MSRAAVSEPLPRRYGPVTSALGTAVTAVWAAGQLEPEREAGRLAVAVNGKTVRGARVGGQAAPHPLSAASHLRSLVLAQHQVRAETNEITWWQHI